ncbi:hypothetical protein Lal_00039650 [Lupinus albus]|nr:hypothetical protein Lal_00039650 [Lupinus albus]
MRCGTEELLHCRFGCRILFLMWVDNNNDFVVDELGFMQVDLNTPGYKDESFILASQAQQVFYANDLENMKWSIVLFTNKIILNNIDDQEYEDIDAEDDPFFGTSLSVRADQLRMMIYIQVLIMMRGSG